MKDQHRIQRPGALLDENGVLREPGYATSLLLKYERDKIRAKNSELRNGIIIT